MKHETQSVPEGAPPVDSETAPPREAIPRDEVVSLLPRCWRLPCPRIGVKWVGRTTLYCDEHGTIYLPDAPWAEFVRKEKL